MFNFLLDTLKKHQALHALAAEIFRAYTMRRPKRRLKELPHLKSILAPNLGKMSKLTAVIFELFRQMISSNKYLLI